jgi:hypothetical protein
MKRERDLVMTGFLVMLKVLLKKSIWLARKGIPFPVRGRTFKVEL